MTDQSAIRKFLFSKAMPNGDVFYYEEEFLMDMLTGVEQSVMVKLVGVRKKGRGPILALSSSAVNNEFDELAPIGTPQQLPLSSRSSLAIATDRAVSHDLRDQSPAPAPTLDLSAYEPKVRYHVARHGKVLEVDPYYPEVQEAGVPVLHEINIGVRERSDSFASTVDDYGNSQRCFDIAASASSSLVTGSDKRMLVRPLGSQSTLWDDHGLDERRQRAVSYDEYFEQSAETPDWVYRTLSPDEQFRPELVELEPFGAPPLSRRLTLNAQANSVVQPGADAANSEAGTEQTAAAVAAPAETSEAVYEATGTNGYDSELAAFSGYTNYAQYYTQDGHAQGLEQVTRGHSRSERMSGQDSRQRYNAYANPALQGEAAFKDFSTPQDRSRSDFSSPRSKAAAQPEPKSQRSAQSYNGISNEFSSNTMVSSAVNGGYQRQTQAQVLRPQLSHPELYERATITTRKPGRTGPIAGVSAKAESLVGTYNPGYDGGTLSSLTGAARYGNYDYAGDLSSGALEHYSAPAPQPKATTKPKASNWREAIVAARSGVAAAAITPDYVAALKGAQAARFTKARRAHSLAHLDLPAVNTYMPEDPHYVPTDSAIAFADQHAAYHQAYSHGHSVSRYAYGADFDDDEGKARKEQLARLRAQRQAERLSERAAHSHEGFTSARDLYDAEGNTWWRDQGLTEQSAQAAFSEENFHQGKHGSFIGTPEEFIPEDKTQQVSTVNAQLVTTSAATIVTAPAPDATVITGDKAQGNKSGQLYQSEPESAPNDHTRIVYNKPQAGLNDDEQAEAYEALRAQESFNDLGAVHHHPNAWDSAAQTKTAYFEDFVPGNAPSGDFADFITADERRKRAQQQPKENVLNARSSYDHSEQDPTHRKPKRLINPQLPQDAVDVAAQAATSSQAQGFKPAPAVAAEVPERLSATPVFGDEPSVPEVAPAPNHEAHATYVAHTANHAYAAAAAQQARNTVQAAPEVTATPEVYGAYGHKAQYGDFDAYGHDEQISSSMVKGYAKQVSAHTAISAGAGTGPYEPAHQGHDFSDFSTADGSKIEGEIKVPVTSQKQAESERLAQQAAAVQAEPKPEAEREPPAEPKVKAETKAESHGAASDETSATAKPVEAPVAEPAPEPKAKPTVSAAVQALAANLVATAAQEIDAEEQAAAEAKAAAAAATSESDADKLGMSKSQLKRAKRRAKARSRGNSGSQAAVSAEVKAAPASTTQAKSAPAASSAVPVAEAKPAPAAAPAAANAVEKVAQAQADAAYLDGIVMNPAASAAPSVNPELMAQAEQYLKGNSQNTESLDIGTARDEAPVLAPSELEGHSALQGLFAGVTPEDDDDVALDGLPNPDAFGAGLDQSFKPDSTPPVPESAFDLGESELKVEPVATPMPLTAKSQEATPATQPQVKAQSNYSVNPITGALSSQPRSLMNGGFNEHTVVVKAEYSLDSLDELHKLFSNSTPTAMPQTGINDSGADTNGFSNNAYQPINAAAQPEQAKSAEPAHRAQEEQERLERVLKEAEAAERARREQEEHEHQEAEAKARAEEHARREQEERERQEAEAKARAEAEERARREQEERERQEAEAKARAEAEAAERARREQEERERQEAEAKARAEAEERARREQEERERQEAEAKARAEAEERARREQEERERQEAEAKARAEAEERARREQEERERQEAEATARAEAEERARREQEERERQEAEAKARAEAEAAERARREQEERERQEAEAKARAEAEAAERARREQEERERQEAEAKARAEAEAAERARREQEERERQEAEAKARAEAEAAERARREQEERERQEAEAKARAEAEAAERARHEQEERKRQEAEAKARAEAAQKQEPSASAANKAASGTDVPENLLFAAPKRFVSGDGAEQAAAPNPERSTSGAAAAAVQAAVAGVLSSSLQPAEHSDDLMKATEEDFLGNSFSETEQNPKLEKASSTSSSLASLAAELIDDFDDPFGDDFAQSIDEDEPRK